MRERRQPLRRGLILFWVALLINVVVSTGALISADRGHDLAVRSQEGLCVEIKFLEGTSATTRALAQRDKDPLTRKARFEGADRADKLAQDLRNLGIHCD